MKRRKTRLSDFHYDILKYIMTFVAKSSDGAASFARAMSVSKDFKELSTDKDILRAVEFQNTKQNEVIGSFWLDNGLLIQCARAKNVSACKIVVQRVEDLLDCAKLKLVASASVSTELEEWIGIVDSRACTRAMSRRIRSTVNVVKILLAAIERDIQQANELALVLYSAAKSC